MKKFYLYILSGLVVMFILSSCASMKKDCNGVKHYKTRNGIYV